MKKTSINLLCVLIVGALALSVLLPAYSLGYSFGAGFRAGWHDARSGKNSLDISQPIEVNFAPEVDQMLNPTSASITTTDGVAHPVVIEKGLVYLPDNQVSDTLLIVQGVAGLIQFVLIVLLFVEFVKFIVNINKGIIFDVKNVKRLRRFGIYLLVLAVLDVVPGLTLDYTLSEVPFIPEGYSMTGAWAFPIADVLIGLVALLMAQVWSYGLTMRCEQELTI